MTKCQVSTVDTDTSCNEVKLQLDLENLVLILRLAIRLQTSSH